MSATVGAVSSTKKDVISCNSHLDEEEVENKGMNNKFGIVILQDCDDVETEELEYDKELDLGPQVSLKEQLEKDKDDESLRKWKEQLLGSVDISNVGESKDPEVKMMSLTITCSDRPNIVLPIPFDIDPKKSLFILKEGSTCRMKFTFTVSNNIVSGLKYTNVVWKTGVRVDNRKKMLGTFSPQEEPYTYELEEETTPCGIFARGTYAARIMFVDDDKKCYMDASYYFEIQKNWATPL
ncbi:putative Rho protein GDP-dissociation inhibitor [Lupinus albus]|uniref:Putative Rho protein GDP-dissociation inhibitor n=1 Tax=Lupinus albus TaxID=3870 RepID=A0A6A4NEK2_LUPAL|nr:putative Rho protein GDP-dissociation inhibitor [Lupinus albus]